MVFDNQGTFRTDEDIVFSMFIFCFNMTIASFPIQAFGTTT